MKKQVFCSLIMATIGTVFTLPASAQPAESVITWGGVIPGGILGSDIGLRAPNGEEIKPGALIAQENGAFTSTATQVRAFALKDVDGTNEVDTDTPYPNAINWYYNGATVTHFGANGNAYTDELLKVKLNGDIVNAQDIVKTEAGNPNMTLSLSYSDAPQGTVTPGDALYAQATLFAEADVGGVSEAM